MVLNMGSQATCRGRLLLEGLNPVTILEMRVRLEEVEFLGHVVSKSGISVDLSKVEAIQNRERPKNVLEIKFKFRGRNLFKEGRL